MSAGKEKCRVYVADNDEQVAELKQYLKEIERGSIICALFDSGLFYYRKKEYFTYSDSDRLMRDMIELD